MEGVNDREKCKKMMKHCKQCGKSFSSRQSLWKHTKICCNLTENQSKDGNGEKVEKSLQDLIEEAGDPSPSVKQKPNWLCGKCMNSYSSRHYLLKNHRCKKRAAGSRRMKDPPHL